MEESVENNTADDVTMGDTPSTGKIKAKKRSLVERELETSLTARVTSPASYVDSTSTSRYGRARRLKTENDFVDTEKALSNVLKSFAEKTPVKTQLTAYKMHASNSPVKAESTIVTPKSVSVDTNLDSQIETIYHENMSLSRFGSSEKKKPSSSPKFAKVYVRKDLIQKRDKEETVMLIKSIFSPSSAQKSSNNHLSNVLERSSEKYNLDSSTTKNKQPNGYMSTPSVVKTLDFDGNKGKLKDPKALTKSEIFELEAKCKYQVGDLAWARMGTYPFWPCIITREFSTGMFVKLKLYGRVEHHIIHVTFFGDNGRHSWIVDNMLRKFLGQLEFEATREHFSPMAKKKDPKLYAAFFVSEKKMPQWSISVEEAETLMREPKRLRIDIFNDMLIKSRSAKVTPKSRKSSAKLIRTGSDVSLSESLYDTLFSEKDRKIDDPDSSWSKNRKSLDVSEVVTACLDNMAAKTGMTKIKRQSHMDRWLQKAKSKTPEKLHIKAVPSKAKANRVNSSKKKSKHVLKKKVPVKKSRKLRKSNKSRNVKPPKKSIGKKSKGLVDVVNDSVVSGSGIGFISKVESLSDKLADELSKAVAEMEYLENDNIETYEVNAMEIPGNNGTMCESPTYTQEFEEAICQNETENKEIETNGDMESKLNPENQKSFLPNNKIYDVNYAKNKTKDESFIDMNGHVVDNTNNNSNIDSHNDSITDISIEIDISFDMDRDKIVNIISVDEDSKKSTEMYSKCNGHDNSKASADNNFNSDNSHSYYDLHNIRKSTRKKRILFSVKPKTSTRKRSLRLKYRRKSEKSKEDSFTKYVELHQDALIDEHPELTQTEIMEYLRKTWQYELNESSNLANNVIEDNKNKEVNNERGVNNSPDSVEHVKHNSEPKKSNLESSDVLEDNVIEIDNSINVTLSNSGNVEPVYIVNDNNVTEGIENEINDKVMTNDTIMICEDKKICNFESEVMNNINSALDVASSTEVKSNDKEYVADVPTDNTEQGKSCDEPYFEEYRSSNSVVNNLNLIDDDEKHKQVLTIVMLDKSEETSCDKLETGKSNFASDHVMTNSLLSDTNKNNEDNLVILGLVIDDEKSFDKLDLEQPNSYITEDFKNSIISATPDQELNLCSTANTDHSVVTEKSKMIPEPIFSTALEITNKEMVVETDVFDIVSGLNQIQPLEIDCTIEPINTVMEKSKSSVSLIDNLHASKVIDEPLSNNVDELSLKKAGNKKENYETKVHEPTEEKNDIIITDEYDIAIEKPLAVQRSNFKDDIETENTDENDVEEKNDTFITDECVITIEKPLAIEQSNFKDDYETENTDENDIVNDNKSDITEADNFELSNKKLPEPIIVNGIHFSDECLPAISDCELNAETSSMHSEDSEPLSIIKNKISLKNRNKANKGFEDPEFLKYMELRQDALMDEHPELCQDQLVEYMYKTWQYEENSKSDLIKIDEMEQYGLVKGLNDNLRQKSIKNSFRENRKRKNKLIDQDTISISSDNSDASTNKSLRTRMMRYPVVVLDDCSKSISKECSPERKAEDMDEISSINSDISDRSLRRTLRKKKDETKVETSGPNSIITSIIENSENVNESATVKDTSPNHTNSESTKNKRYFDIFKQTESKEQNNSDPEIKEFDKNIMKELDPETVSINSEDGEVSVSKRKQRKYGEKLSNKDLDNPEFLKYFELRQDVLIDENPQLSQEEIMAYLYKTWLYEESMKSDIKKSDDIEQANLVKGLCSDAPQPKKNRKKIKTEKESTFEDVSANKDKPKRKVSQPYYNENLSDTEDDIELFEIFKPKNKLQGAKVDHGEIKSETYEVTDLQDVEVIDEVESYFSELTKPKPNLFKGLVREKVCDICEKTGSLVKCKKCNNTFHVDCVKKVVEVVESPSTPVRGRKKKKKPGRKPKNLDESESQSDEKSQDISEENNASIEEIIESESWVVDADNFEAVLEAKMKELIPNGGAHYDAFSCEESINWNGTIAGKCEIIDINNKSKLDTTDYSDFKCNSCQTHEIPVCFVCKKAVSKSGIEYRQRCQTAHCWKYYHMECLDHWPQTQFNAGELSKTSIKDNEKFDDFMCSRHVCHTCVSDDPRGCKTRFCGDKLARCVRCPATYHTFTKCLPAGTQILTGSHIVCPRHHDRRPGKVPCHVNTGWCFLCALGGSLICCEYCPTSFHAECLNIKPPEGGYMCEDCETGRLPLYGEMVWVKLGHYRWWPGLILHPKEVPENIMAVKHSPGEFVVRFFGQYDHYWVNRGRVFPFQEGDSGRISSQKSKIDAAFTMAMEHAQRACEILKSAETNEEEDTDIASSLLPPRYVKLKVNKPVGSLCGKRIDIEESSLTQCECNPDEEDPCGLYSQCLNRMLLTECGPLCRAGDRCSNRAFEKRQYPRIAPYRTPHRGWGLKSLQDIKAGQFVIEYVGELIDEEEFRRRMNRKHEIRDENFYFLTLDKERMIDAGPKGNFARFMNHCCEPNCETQKWTVLGDVRVGLFAIKDIPANSELTFNYNLECAGIEKKKCLCGAKRCSGYIGAKPKQEETQPKKNKLGKRPYKKRKNLEDSPSITKNKPKRPVGRPAKPRELTEIEKDLLIIKNATNGLSSDSEASSRLSSIELDRSAKALKRKRFNFSTDEASSPSTKKAKVDEEKAEVGD